MGRRAFSTSRQWEYHPLSFVAYTLALSPGTFVSEVAEHLDLPPSHNILTMAKIIGLLLMSADPKLGTFIYT